MAGELELVEGPAESDLVRAADQCGKYGFMIHGCDPMSLHTHTSYVYSSWISFGISYFYVLFLPSHSMAELAEL